MCFGDEGLDDGIDDLLRCTAAQRGLKLAQFVDAPIDVPAELIDEAVAEQ